MQSRQIDLTINKMTKAQYNAITPNADEIYLITDDNGLTQSDITTALGYTPVNPTSLATVATTGSYNDLADKPYIPSGVIVDQTFDPTSQNAQSGVAINGAGFLTGITSSDVTTALGYTPYNSTNPSGYITSSALNGYATQSWVASQGYTTNTGTVTSVNNVQPVNGNVTISIPTVPTNISAFTNDSGYITSSALTGYATQSWVGQQGYITGIGSTDVTTALGYTPYNSSNPNGYTSNVGTVTSVNNTEPDTNGNVNISIPSAVTESTVAGWGFTKNTGTVTSVNNVQPVNGNVTINIPDVSNFVTNSSLATTLDDYVKSSLENTTQGTTATIGYVSGFAPVMQLTYGNYQMLCGCGEGALLAMIDTTTNIQTAISAIPAGITIKQGQQQALLTLSNNNLLVNGSEIATQSWVGQQGYITGINSSDVTTALGYTPVNIDMSNISTAGKIAIANIGYPTTTSRTLGLQSSGSSYRAPADGWVHITLALNLNGYVAVNGVYSQSGTAEGGYSSVFYPVSKGETFTVVYSNRTSTPRFKFYYAKGTESEAT